MDILVVEDDGFKFSKIEKLIKSTIKNSRITHFDNVCRTLQYLKENTPDKIILDMALPSHAPKAREGSPLSMPSGGIEIILELRYLKKNKLPVIVLTQYPDIVIEGEYCSMEESEEKIKQLYGMRDLIVANYDNDSNYWKTITEQFLRS